MRQTSWAAQINNRDTCTYVCGAWGCNRPRRQSYHVGYGSKNTTTTYPLTSPPPSLHRLLLSSQWQRGVCSMQVKILMRHRLLSECTYPVYECVCVCVWQRPQVALGNPAKCLVYNEHIMKSDGKWIFNFYQQRRRLQNLRYFFLFCFFFFFFFFFLIELCAANAGDVTAPACHSFQ